MLERIQGLAKKPAIDEKSDAKFWDDPYISSNMLEAHLNPEVEAATRKLEFVEKSVNWMGKILPPGLFGRLLDLGCGPGIYAELLDGKGYKVTGMDISEKSIEYAKKEAKKKGLDIEYCIGDYIQEPIQGEYDLATMIYCDYGVLDGRERALLLSKVYEVLAPGGCFLLDVFTPFAYENREETKTWSFEEKGFWSREPYLLLQALYRYDQENTFLNQYIVSTQRKICCYNIWEHTFLQQELAGELKRVGFKEMEFFGDVAGAPYEKESKTLCVVAKK